MRFTDANSRDIHDDSINLDDLPKGTPITGALPAGLFDLDGDITTARASYTSTERHPYDLTTSSQYYSDECESYHHGGQLKNLVAKGRDDLTSTGLLWGIELEVERARIGGLESFFEAYQKSPLYYYSKLEEDSSLRDGVEIISGMLTDGAYTWYASQLARLMDKCNRAGMIRTSGRTGLHVHVSGLSDDQTDRIAQAVYGYDNDRAAGTFNDDSVWELTGRGTTSSTQYCARKQINTMSLNSTNFAPDRTGRTWRRVDHPYLAGLKNFSGDHYCALSYRGESGTEGSHTHHIEYRMWRASCNATILKNRLTFTQWLTKRAARYSTVGKMLAAPEAQAILSERRHLAEA